MPSGMSIWKTSAQFFTRLDRHGVDSGLRCGAVSCAVQQHVLEVSSRATIDLFLINSTCGWCTCGFGHGGGLFLGPEDLGFGVPISTLFRRGFLDEEVEVEVGWMLCIEGLGEVRCSGRPGTLDMVSTFDAALVWSRKGRWGVEFEMLPFFRYFCPMLYFFSLVAYPSVLSTFSLFFSVWYCFFPFMLPLVLLSAILLLP
ncbi:hypothetical protein BJ165DRAFT_1126205 [Panaeolus papilionaceus]|nr:hypothetical protein BJ165DRAFT_1126205 [Panaeolus papilionaceus]